MIEHDLWHEDGELPEPQGPPVYLWSYDETAIQPLWTEDNFEFPEALWLSNLPDGEEWGV